MLRPFPTGYRWLARRRRRPLRVEPLESRRLLSAAPLGATAEDTGEFLLGSVAVTPVFLESDGSGDAESQDWTGEEIDQMLAKIGEGVNWWSETLDELGSVHSLDFIIDDTYAADPFETPFEPIDRTSDAVIHYAGDFFDHVGHGDAGSLEAKVHGFNHDQRLKLGTDWAFTLFVADASEDADGKFAAGGSFGGAFAFPGGQFFITPSTRPASTIAHELGHIFWARDEYVGAGSWQDQRGYYNAHNLNASDNPALGFEPEISIMRGGTPLTEAYDQHVSPASTLAMVGWRDSDGDGVFDVADVPLELEASGYFDADTSRYHFAGSASAVPLRNQNSSGHQSDITLNRISQLQYSLDGGPWIAAAQPDSQTAEFDLSVDLAAAPSSMRWRVIDEATGITSEILETAPGAMLPLFSGAVSGYAFVDGNGNGERDAGEASLPETAVSVVRQSGASLFAGAVAASDFAEGYLPETLPGVSLRADGLILDSRAGVGNSPRAGDVPVFRSFNIQLAKWNDGWSEDAALTVDLEEPVAQVEVDVLGLGAASYGRVEAFDSNGNRLIRSTGGALGAGESATVALEDASGRIASLRVFGHASSEVAIRAIRFGSHGDLVTGHQGLWSVENLPNGRYEITASPQLPIYQFTSPAVVVDVLAGSGPVLAMAAQRVPSPRHNVILPHDVDGSSTVTARDALLVINELTRSGPAILPAGDSEGPHADVNDDGRLSAADALLVINELARNGGHGESPASDPTTTASDASASPAVSGRSSMAAIGSVDPNRSAGTQRSAANRPFLSVEIPESNTEGEQPAVGDQPISGGLRSAEFPEVPEKEIQSGEQRGASTDTPNGGGISQDPWDDLLHLLASSVHRHD